MVVQFEDMWLKEVKLFIIEFNKASQLYRSFSKPRPGLNKTKKIEIRRSLVDYCIILMRKIDNNSLKNETIRFYIKKLVSIDKEHISFGQAQKVINVCLKQYCFLLKKKSLVKELDCPLDSITMKDSKIKNKGMKTVTEKDYLNYQEEFAKEYSIRVFKDRDYDENRIKDFFDVQA